MSEETRIETVQVYQFDQATRAIVANSVVRRHIHTTLDPERFSTGSAGHGTFNPAARGSSPPGFAMDH
jgi:hypothetical protein